MERLQKVALLTAFAEKLREAGSWCGETHIQKATYFLQELLGVPTGFNFVFYKHGPFSFDLRDELTASRADGLLELEPREFPYGPSLAVTKYSSIIQNLYSDVLDQYDKQLDFVTAKLGEKGVAKLEELATALYVSLEMPGKDVPEKANRIHELKPHISPANGRSAIETIDIIIQEAEEYNLRSGAPKAEAI